MKNSPITLPRIGGCYLATPEQAAQLFTPAEISAGECRMDVTCVGARQALAGGLETGEQERIDAFLKSEGLSSPVDCESEASFCHWCDAPGELAGDMLLFRFPVAP